MAGEWDVVEETQTKGPSAPGEWDVAAETPLAKRQVGAGETAARAGSGFVHAAKAYSFALPVGGARLVDLASRAIGIPPPGGRTLEDRLGDIVVPDLAAANSAAINPQTEDAGPVGNVVIPAATEIGKSAPDLLTGVGLQSAGSKAIKTVSEQALTHASAIKDLARRVIDNSLAGVPAGFRRAGERQAELEQAGVSPLAAAPQAALSGTMTAGQFALPVSAGSAAATLPGRVVSRGAQGAALGTSAGVSAQQAEDAMAPASMGQNPLTAENLITQAFMNAMFGQMGGRNAKGGHPTREQLGYPKPLELAPQEPPAPREPVPPVHDPMEAAKLVNEVLHASPEGAPLPPEGLGLVPRDTAMPGPMQPDVSEVPYRVPADMALEGGGLTGAERVAKFEERAARQASRQPERPATVAVDEKARAIPLDGEGQPTDRGSIAGLLQNELARRAAQEAEARKAFDVAEAQRQRKQSAQDTGTYTGKPMDLREARAGGTASPEGTAATTPERFTFYNAKVKDGQMTEGDRVEVRGEPFTAKDEAGKDVQMQGVRFVDRPGQPEMPVPVKSLSGKERPANPRFAQDIAATTYAPPKGVGTSEHQPAPREAAQRITTERSPDFIPAEQQTTRGEATRPGRDVTDLAFDRLPKETANASAVRGHQGQLPAPREVGQGSGADRGGHIQQEPAQGGSGDGAELRGAGVDRGQDARTPFDEPRAVGEGRIDVPPDLHDSLRTMASNSRHLERGGQLIRKEVPNRGLSGGGVSEDLSRTAWVGQPEWAKGFGMTPAEIGTAVEKAIAGQRLGAKQGAIVETMIEEVHATRRNMDEALNENHLPPQSEADVSMIADAARIDEVAVERLAQQADGGAISEQQFMDGIRRIVDGKQSAENGVGGETVQRSEGRPAATDAGATRGASAGDELRPPNSGGQREGSQPSESRPPAFDLERPSEQQLSADAARRDAAGAEQRRVENAPSPKDFTLTGSDRPADEAAARGQNELFTPDSTEKKSAGGGTLYGGLPLDHVAKALSWAFGDVKAWHDSIGKLSNDIRDAAGKVASGEVNPVWRFVRAMLDSASGDMRSTIAKHPSKTAQWVMDQFHTEAGSDRATGEIWSSAVNAWANKQMTRLDAAIKAFEGNKAAMEQIAALVRNPQGIKAGSKVHDAAATIRSMLDEALKYMKDAGVNIGEVRDGYYPREFDMRAVMRDPASFVKAAAQAFRETGLSASDAEASAKQLHDGMVFGESGSIFRNDRGSPQAPFLKGRTFGKQVDNAQHPLNTFLMHDPSQAIPIYLERAAKRAEIARRFGDRFEKWGEIEKKIIAEGGGPALGKLRGYVSLAAKLKSPGVSDGMMRAASVARTWGSLMFLEKATLSSLTEFIVPAIRTGNPLDMLRSFSGTVGDLVSKTKGAAERRAFAEDLGIISSHLSDQVSAARFSGGEPVSMLESKILAKYFRRTGLTQWTDATFVGAADLGRVFVRRLAKELEGGGGKLNERYLAELGVPKDKQAEFSKYVLSKNDGMLSAGDMAGPMGDLYRASIRRFSQQSIMKPDATLRPAWMAHPLGSIVGQLQSFNYAFFENVLKRTGRLAKEAVTGADYTMLERARLMMPMVILPMLTAAAYAVGETRDAAFGDPEKRKEETKGQKVLKAISRGSPIAPIDPLLNYATSAKYQRSAADNFAGPVLGTAGRGMDAARQVLLNNTPKTNTAERQAAKAFYDIVIEPIVNLMLTASPVTVAAAAATQAAGAGGMREKFATAVAGPQKKSPPRPRYDVGTQAQ